MRQAPRMLNWPVLSIGNCAHAELGGKAISLRALRRLNALKLQVLSKKLLIAVYPWTREVADHGAGNVQLNSSQSRLRLSLTGMRPIPDQEILADPGSLDT